MKSCPNAAPQSCQLRSSDGPVLRARSEFLRCQRLSESSESPPTVAHAHSQPHRSYQCVSSLSGRCRISYEGWIVGEGVSSELLLVRLLPVPPPVEYVGPQYYLDVPAVCPVRLAEGELKYRKKRCEVLSQNLPDLTLSLSRVKYLPRQV
ncbi:hypothetical protein EVAR_13043_1 [Eumeta japonica]|uniref:Uncharacterized protein n=1 Tax=Eumeta variegata TaxID=151549 RepID=A0A4C1VH70_EUMVA|nr:hypothetical protein EVAR_13043_1 [Eumeta japonica]